ncbi:MAG: hypothetical protein EOP08_00970 [Proteobacteria bacterium]|nr:MAG: hypothetical protein EOP08_00970 [Pseudomonadota bacterium]
MTIPPRPADTAATQWYCGSMFGDYETFEVRATLRPDGIAVLRLPAFAQSAEHPFPQPLTQAGYEQWISAYVDRLKTALDSVAGARAYIWDARSNRGGSSEVGLAIVAGTPGAERETIIQCGRRTRASTPFAFTSEIDFEIPDEDRLAVTGKVAVLVDGRAYSGGDIFAYAMRNHTSARLFGTPTAGAFGFGGNAAVTVGTPVRMAYTADGRRCTDMAGTPLEGHGVEPHELVEPTAADLAAGRDTVLDAAVTWIGQ